MATIKRFEDLEIWQQSSDVAVQIFHLTSEKQFNSDWGIRDQLRRSAFSISSNIAEGFEYDNNKEFVRFLKYAKGSAGELRSQLSVIHKVGYLTGEKNESYQKQLITISKSLAGFIKYLKTKK